MATEDVSESGLSTGWAALPNQLLETLKLNRMLAIYTVLVGVYVYLPLISLIVFSFNDGGLSFPFTEFTLDWYGKLLQNDSMNAAIFRSLKLAFVVMIVTTVLSTLALIAYRREFRGKRLFLYLVILGIITPGITYSIGATIFINNILGLPRNLWAALPVHVIWTFPFSFIILLAGTPAEIAKHEEAAQTMGADRITVFREITLPQIGPAVLGAAVFALTLSYNEGTRSILLLGSDTTLPVFIFSAVASTSPTPQLFALGSVTTAVSWLLLAVSFGIVLYRSV
jgi:putative spermidine/putrescine transport system permease protein